MERFGICKTEFLAMLLFGTSVIAGCASTAVMKGGAAAVESYDVPETSDLAEIIGVVERTFTEVLGGPVTLSEGAVPSPLPSEPSPPLLEERPMALEPLGTITVPHVHCPGAIGMIHKLSPAPHGFTLVASCVLPYRGAVRIHLVTARPGGSAFTQFPSAIEAKDPASSLLSSLGLRLQVQLGQARRVASTVGAAVAAANHGSHEAERRELGAPKGSADTAPGQVATAKPLVCLEPRTDHVPIIATPDSALVVGTLERDLIVDGDGPVSRTFFRVKTPEGAEGWVKRSDLRWQPCPIA